MNAIVFSFENCMVDFTVSCVKVSVYPKFDDFSKKLFFTFSDRSYCNLSSKKNSMKKD